MAQTPKHLRPSLILFDWGDTLMRDDDSQVGPMYLWDSVTAMPDAYSVLASLHPHYQLGLASNAAQSTAIEIRAALARVGLSDFIDRIFCRQDIGHSKLDPQFWQAIIAHSQLSPASILMIGDDYAKDVAAPCTAGLQTIWFNWRGHPAQNCPTINQLQELPERLGCDLLES